MCIEYILKSIKGQKYVIQQTDTALPSKKSEFIKQQSIMSVITEPKGQKYVIKQTDTALPSKKSEFIKQQSIMSVITVSIMYYYIQITK